MQRETEISKQPPVHFLSKTLTALLLVGLVGILLHVFLGPHAFEWAKLDLDIDRNSAIEKSQEFLANRDLSPAQSTRLSARFWTHEKAHIFLQKSLGETERNELLDSEVAPLWGWSVRAFQPDALEEQRVWWSPKGKFLGFYADRPQDLPKNDLNKDEAIERVRVLGEELFPEDFQAYEFADHSSDRVGGLLEHTVRFDRRLPDSKLRIILHFTLSGTFLRSARYRLELPASFVHTEAGKLQSRTVLANTFFFVNKALLFIAILFLLWGWKKGLIRWRRILPFAGLVLVIRAAAAWNRIPHFLHTYDVRQDWNVYWITEFLFAAADILGASIWIFFLLSVADVFGRLFPRASHSLGEMTKAGFFRSSTFLRSTLAGVGAAGAHLGFVTLYYFFGTRFFGFYSPQDIPFDNLLATKLPWIQPMLTGLEPTLTEEGLYRLFAIPLVFLLTKRKILSIVLPAFLWGFLHTTYYVDPIYARGLELFLVGIFLGWVFWRFGIWATLVAHYAYNATVSSTLLFASKDPWLPRMAILVILFALSPTLLSVLHFLRKGTFTEFPFDRLNWRAIRPKPRPSRERRLHSRYPAAIPSQFGRVLFIVSLPTLLLILPFFRLPQLHIDASDAKSLALNVTENLGFQPQISKASTVLDEIETVETSLSRPELIPVLKEIMNEDPVWKMTMPQWNVRVITHHIADHCLLSFSGSSVLLGYSCSVDRDLPGDGTEKESIRRNLESLLSSWRYPVQEYAFFGITSKKRRERRDYEYSWIDPRYEVFDLRRSLNISTVNGYPVTFRSHLFERSTRSKTAAQDHKRGFADNLPLIGLIFGVFVGLFLLIRIFLRFSFSDHAPYRLAMKFGLIALATGLLRGLNRYPQVWSKIQPSETEWLYLFEKILNSVGYALTLGLASFALILLFCQIGPKVFLNAPGSEDFARLLQRFPWKWRGSSQGMLWALAILSFQYAIRLVMQGFQGESVLPLDYPFQSFSTLFAPINLLYDAWFYWMLWLGFALLLVSLKDLTGKWFSWALFGVGIPSLIFFYFTDFFHSPSSLIELVVLLFLVLRFVGFHLPFYFWYTVLHLTFPYVFCLTSTSPSILWTGVSILLALSAIAGRTWWQVIRYRIQKT